MMWRLRTAVGSVALVLILPLLVWQLAIEGRLLLQPNPLRLSTAGAAGRPVAAEIPRETTPGFLMPPPERYAVVVERPLFHPSRQPPIEPQTVAQIETPAALSAVLRGVVFSGDRRIALVGFEDRAEVLQLSQGDSYLDWRIERIDSEKVVLRRGDEEAVLHLAYRPGANGSR